ncbi:MAG TPA: hypothetical protein VIK94_02305, partial [Bacilli bacterium]
MKIKRIGMIKILGKVLHQAFKEGKIPFLILFILNLINSLSMYFGLIVPELATNISYTFIKNKDADFLTTIMPFIKVLIILLMLNISSFIY